MRSREGARPGVLSGPSSTPASTAPRWWCSWTPTRTPRTRCAHSAPGRKPSSSTLFSTSRHPRCPPSPRPAAPPPPHAPPHAPPTPRGPAPRPHPTDRRPSACVQRELGICRPQPALSQARCHSGLTVQSTAFPPSAGRRVPRHHPALSGRCHFRIQRNGVCLRPLRYRQGQCPEEGRGWGQELFPTTQSTYYVLALPRSLCIHWLLGSLQQARRQAK